MKGIINTHAMDVVIRESAARKIAHPSIAKTSLTIAKSSRRP